MARERRYGKTPSGGDYSEMVYTNNLWHEVSKEEATHCIIHERMNDGTSIFRTYGILKPPEERNNATERNMGSNREEEDFDR